MPNALYIGGMPNVCPSSGTIGTINLPTFGSRHQLGHQVDPGQRRRLRLACDRRLVQPLERLCAPAAGTARTRCCGTAASPPSALRRALHVLQSRGCRRPGGRTGTSPSCSSVNGQFEAVAELPERGDHLPLRLLLRGHVRLGLDLRRRASSAGAWCSSPAPPSPGMPYPFTVFTRMTVGWPLCSVGGLVRGVHLQRVVPAALQRRDLAVRQVFDQRLQFRRVEEVLRG